MNIGIHEYVLSETLGAPTEGIRSLRLEQGSEICLKICGSLDDLNI